MAEGWRGQLVPFEDFEEEAGWGQVQTGRVEKGFTSSDFTTLTFGRAEPPLFLAMFELMSSFPLVPDFLFTIDWLGFRGRGFILVNTVPS